MHGPQEPRKEQKEYSFLNALFETWATRILASAGIGINGAMRYDLEVHDPTFYRHAMLGGSLKFGEGFQNGAWDCRDIPGMCARLRNIRIPLLARVAEIPLRVRSAIRNRQSRKFSQKNVAEHYDFGNDFYEAWLDPSMQYSCAYFENGARSLNDAQQAKKQLIGDKLQLKSGMRVLDIGCGWGGLAAYLAQHWDVKVVGITLSIEQHAYACKKYAHLIEKGVLEFRFMDYRDDVAGKLGQFDRVVSVGMLEHVGEGNLAEYRDAIDSCLKPGGLALVHSIVGETGREDPWIDRYVFPGGVLPRIKRIKKVFETGGFHAWDWHRFGKSYARTLICWRENFLKAWPELQKDPPHHPRDAGPYDTLEYKKWFKRTWLYYLDMSSGAFEGGHIDLCQVLFSKQPKPADYQEVR